MLGEFRLFFTGHCGRRLPVPKSVADRKLCRLTTHRSISTTATAHIAMSAGTSAASASAPPSSSTPIAKRIMPRRPAPKTEAKVGKSSIGQPADRARDKTKRIPQEFGSAMAGRANSFTQSACRVNAMASPRRGNGRSSERRGSAPPIGQSVGRYGCQRDPARARPSHAPIVGAGKFRSANLLTTSSLDGGTSSIGRCSRSVPTRPHRDRLGS